MKDIVLNIVVDGLFTQIYFRMILKNNIRRLSLFKKWFDHKTKFLDLVDSGIDTDTGINKLIFILMFSYICRIDIFVIMTGTISFASIACAG